MYREKNQTTFYIDSEKTDQCFVFLRFDKKIESIMVCSQDTLNEKGCI